MRKLFVIIVILIIVAAVILMITRRQADTPVQAVPEQEYPIAYVSFYLQNDPRWSDDALGSSRFRMAGSGCLVSCIASSLDAQGIDIDPGRLNQMFTGNDVYNSEGEMLWSEISNVFPDVHVAAPARVDPAALEKAVAEGLFPIVKVKYKGAGYKHWVILIGAVGGDYLCMDPLNPGKEPLPLSEHGGVVYRCRIVSVDQ